MMGVAVLHQLQDSQDNSTQSVKYVNLRKNVTDLTCMQLSSQKNNTLQKCSSFPYSFYYTDCIGSVLSQLCRKQRSHLHEHPFPIRSSFVRIFLQSVPTVLHLTQSTQKTKPLDKYLFSQGVSSKIPNEKKVAVEPIRQTVLEKSQLSPDIVTTGW